MTIIGDCGPEVGSSSYINLMYWGRLWNELNISRLTSITYPAGHRAYNPIGNALTSVAIPVTTPAEDQTPNRQTHRTKDELENKAAKMLYNVSNILKEYWDNLTYDRNPVIPIPIKSKSESSEYKNRASVKKQLQQLKIWNQIKKLLLSLERNSISTVDILTEEEISYL